MKKIIDVIASKVSSIKRIENKKEEEEKLFQEVMTDEMYEEERFQ